MHRGLFGSGRARVDADVARDQVRLAVGVRALVLRDQPPRPGIGLVGLLEVLVLGLGLLVLGLRLGVGVGFRFLLGEELVEGLALFLLFLGGAEPVRGGPAVRREDARVELIVPGILPSSESESGMTPSFSAPIVISSA